MKKTASHGPRPKPLCANCGHDRNAHVGVNLKCLFNPRTKWSHPE